MIGQEDHGILTCYVMLDYGGSGQGFGGYALDTAVKDAEGKFLRREGTAFGMQFIQNILDTIGVEKWEDLKGKHCRVELTEHGWGKILRIGHFLNDKWFNPEDLFKKLGA